MQVKLKYRLLSVLQHFYAFSSGTAEKANTLHFKKLHLSVLGFYNLEAAEYLQPHAQDLGKWELDLNFICPQHLFPKWLWLFEMLLCILQRMRLQLDFYVSAWPTCTSLETICCFLRCFFFSADVKFYLKFLSYLVQTSTVTSYCSYTGEMQARLNHYCIKDTSYVRSLQLCAAVWLLNIITGCCQSVLLT